MGLLVLCAAALLGIALGDLGRIAEPLRLLFGALVALLGACLVWRHSTWRWLALGAVSVALGGLRAATTEPAPPSPLAPYVGHVIRLGGERGGPPNLSGSGGPMRVVAARQTLRPARP